MEVLGSAGEILKGSFVSTVTPTMHTYQSRKRNFSKNVNQTKGS